MLLSSCLLTIVFRYTIGELIYRELIMSTNSVLFLLRYELDP